MRFGSLFSGIGGLDLGLERAGMEVAWQVESDPFCRKVLAKHWPGVQRFEDVRGCGAHNLERVGLIAGGFPCQDISLAGRGVGIDGERSGLWTEFARILRELRPRFALVENVSALLARGMDRVLGDLAELGYDAEWSCLSACAMGAPHSRERVFLFAYSDRIGRGSWRDHDGDGPRFDYWEAAEGKQEWRDVELWIRQTFQDRNGATSGPETIGVDDGVPDRVDRIRALGNAVVPQVAEWIGRRILEAASA